MSEYEVVIKRVPSMQVAGVRGVVATPADQNLLWARALVGIKDNSAISNAPCISLYHDEEPKEQDWDIEVCLPLAREVAVGDGVSCRELPAIETMASILHNGPFLNISNAYAAVISWIHEHSYAIAGPAREVNLHVPGAGDGRADQADPSTVVEVQFPLKRV